MDAFALLRGGVAVDDGEVTVCASPDMSTFALAVVEPALRNGGVATALTPPPLRTTLGPGLGDGESRSSRSILAVTFLFDWGGSDMA